MIEIKDFIKEELNDFSREIINKTIQNGRNSSIDSDEIIFNKFSLEFCFKENLVVIYDDVFSEEEPLSLNIDTFVLNINNQNYCN